MSDARISLIGEIIDGIKTVKLNSLDHGFRSKVELLRAKELTSIRRALTLNAYNQVREQWGAKIVFGVLQKNCIVYDRQAGHVRHRSHHVTGRAIEQKRPLL